MRKKLFAALAAALAAAVLLAGCGAANKKLRFGAAGLGGVYNAFAVSYTQLAQAAQPELEFEVKATAGSAANLRLLSQGYIQLAIAQVDLASDAYAGTGSFAADGPCQGYSAVAGLYTEACQLVVRADSDIAAVSDLLGKTVSIGEAESGTEQNARQILEAAGLSEKLVTEVNLSYTDAAQQLSEGQIDAMFCTAGLQTTVLEELAQQCAVRLIPIDGECAAKLKTLYGFYSDFTVPAGTYTGQTEAVPTVGVCSVLLASDKLSADTVQALTALLFEKQAELQYSVPVDLHLSEENATQNIVLPFHPGAAAYYAEKGISVDTAKGE